jgi:hypothetical protein
MGHQWRQLLRHRVPLRLLYRRRYRVRQRQMMRALAAPVARWVQQAVHGSASGN